jgi:putative flavoprotein involved in K+ transport
MRRTDVLIVGAGQAGLALGRCLARAGIDHAILERGQVGARWRADAWESLRLLTPNWMTRLPGYRYAGPDPDGFMDRAALLALLQDYARAGSAPVHEMTRVIRVRGGADGLRVATTTGGWAARAVVIATGACERPAVPAWAAEVQAHHLVPTSYRRPEALPEGGVLVVGAAASGVQIARELRAAGRAVTLAVGRHTRLPRRYRGRDIMHWLDAAGMLDESWDGAPRLAAARRQPSLQLTGQDGGAALDLALLAAEGVRLVGRAEGAAGGARIAFGGGLRDECIASEARRRRVLERIDAHIARTGDAAPADPGAWNVPWHPACPRQVLDLGAERIRTVVWATGYRRDYGWLRLPVFDRAGEIAHRGGVTAVPGLFAIGLPFLRRRSSTFIDGVGRDAEALAPQIAAHLDRPRALAA